MTIHRDDLNAGRIDFSDIAEPGAETIGPIHPGERLRGEWLDPLGISAYRLAKDIGVPPDCVTEILNGRRAISAETALRLARYFGTDAQSWLDLQSTYDLAMARRTAGPLIDEQVHPRAG